ncbi:predicted protein [Histoplasma capsulatum var. duboisii H88]|uniref:Predicted protein n=1 Tax=Ajellomyces capsulatus (strain H88) TaxID=544711 RepID=F0URF8_AJEC8|nr:predicted protein [Histoplasma capsulatum var. duboisii H88]
MPTASILALSTASAIMIIGCTLNWQHIEVRTTEWLTSVSAYISAVKTLHLRA